MVTSRRGCFPDGPDCCRIVALAVDSRTCHQHFGTMSGCNAGGFGIDAAIHFNEEVQSLFLAVCRSLGHLGPLFQA